MSALAASKWDAEKQAGDTGWLAGPGPPRSGRLEKGPNLPGSPASRVHIHELSTLLLDAI